MLLQEYLERQRSRSSRNQAQRLTLWRRYGGRCWYCGEAVSVTAFVLDHLAPFCRGGSNGQHNLVVACSQCDYDKRSMTLDEFREARGGIEFDGEKRGLARRGRIVRPFVRKMRDAHRPRAKSPDPRMVWMREAFERAGITQDSNMPASGSTS